MARGWKYLRAVRSARMLEFPQTRRLCFRLKARCSRVCCTLAPRRGTRNPLWNKRLCVPTLEIGPVGSQGRSNPIGRWGETPTSMCSTVPSESHPRRDGQSVGADSYPSRIERRQRRCRGGRSRAIADCRCPAGPFILVIIGFYLALGTFMEGFAMIVTTIPVVTALGYDPIWRGVIVTMLIEIAMVSPPDGIIMYVLQGMRRTTGPIIDVFAGVMQSVSTCLRS